MLTKPQIWKLKAAQRQAGVEDEEYRATLRQFFGVESSKAPEIGNEHWDTLMSYFEAVYWRGVDAGRLPAPCTPAAPFQKRGYWAAKNTRAETSRDRHNFNAIRGEIARLEAELNELGCPPRYLNAIRDKVTRGQESLSALHHYRGALLRTRAARLNHLQVEEPF